MRTAGANPGRKAWTLRFITVSAALFAMLGAAASAHGAVAQGRITAIDLDASTVVVHERNGTTTTVHVTPSTVLTRNGKSTILPRLALRDVVRARFDAATTDARSLRAAGPAVKTLRGKVVSARKGRGAVTLASGGRSGAGAGQDQYTVKTDRRTRIVRNGAPASLSHLTSRDKVVAHVRPDGSGKRARDLVVSGPEHAKVKGLISAIDGDTLTIVPKDEGVHVTLGVTPGTLIEVNGHPGTVADLLVGQYVEAYYDPTTFAAFSIEAEHEGDEREVEGTVVEVNAAAGTVTIAPADGGPAITLTVTASTEIEVNDEPAALEALQAGMPIEAEFDEVTLVARELEAGAGDDEHDDDDDDGEDEAEEDDDDDEDGDDDDVEDDD
jgi:hypothetical protein